MAHFHPMLSIDRHWDHDGNLPVFEQPELHPPRMQRMREKNVSARGLPMSEPHSIRSLVTSVVATDLVSPDNVAHRCGKFIASSGRTMTNQIAHRLQHDESQRVIGQRLDRHGHGGGGRGQEGGKGEPTAAKEAKFHEPRNKVVLFQITRSFRWSSMLPSGDGTASIRRQKVAVELHESEFHCLRYGRIQARLPPKSAPTSSKQASIRMAPLSRDNVSRIFRDQTP